MSLNHLRDEALRIATEHGFTEASVGEDFMLIVTEVAEAMEDHRSGEQTAGFWYEDSFRSRRFPSLEAAHASGEARPKPCGIPSELADIIIRALHFAGKHGIDIERAVSEKMAYNETRPFKNGGKVV